MKRRDNISNDMAIEVSLLLTSSHVVRSFSVTRLYVHLLATLSNHPIRRVNVIGQGFVGVTFDEFGQVGFEGVKAFFGDC